MFSQAKLTNDLAQRQIRQITYRMYEDLNTPVSLSCYMLLKYEEYEQLVNKEVNPYSYNTAWDFQLDYQACSILSKYPDLDTGIDRKAVALAKFMESEAKCLDTNRNLQQRLREKSHVNSIVYAASRKIAAWLDDEKIRAEDFRFGPGASSSCCGSDTHIAGKLQSDLECTLDSIPFVKRFFAFPHFTSCARAKSGIDGDYSSLSSPIVNILPGNRLTFVPKNAKTDRVICIEPHLNICSQLMIGAALRRALRKGGLDLNHAAPRINSKLACCGSIDGSYATIDLSSASDTISYNLIWELFPTSWASLMDSVRSKFTTLPDGTLVENQKFSSMGNGFTFEMETMIFYSLSKACAEYLGVYQDVSVFGDDIVVPTSVSGLLIEVLECCGFTTNQRKTFTHGPFRESCGKDYFLGTNVRPYFIKETHTSVIELYKVLNGVRHVCVRLCGVDHVNDPLPILKRTWTLILRFIPDQYRLFGPQHLGDQVIWSPRREALSYVKSQFGIMNIKIAEPVRPVRGFNTYNISVQFASLLLGASSNGFMIRGKSSNYRFRSIPISAWSWDEGSWLG